MQSHFFDQSKPNRRRFQFSLRSLFVVVTVAALVCALLHAIASRLPNENRLTQKQLQSVKAGMTADQVLDLLGRPDAIRPDENGSIDWEYGGLWPDLVEFKDGRVVSAYRF
jgi:SmpA / OmlA family